MLVSVKPSIISATAVIFGLFSAYRMQTLVKKKGEKTTELFGDFEIKTVSFAWNEISQKLFDEASSNELEEFMKEISERLSYINHKYGRRLEHIFVKEL